jgi:hypothetical protein
MSVVRFFWACVCEGRERERERDIEKENQKLIQKKKEKKKDYFTVACAIEVSPSSVRVTSSGKAA